VVGFGSVRRGGTTGDSAEQKKVSEHLLWWRLPSSHNMLKATKFTLKDYLSQ
jgi:hypothetical protein